MQKQRIGRTTRKDMEQDLGDALAGNAGTPSDTNRFVTEQGLGDVASAVTGRMLILEDGRLVWGGPYKRILLKETD